MDNIKGKAKEISDDIGLGVEGESKAGTKLHLSNENAKHERSAEEDAAIVVQRAWRHYSIRKNNSSADARWKDALTNAEKEAVNEEAERGDKNDPRSRFRRGVFLAGRLEDGDALMTTTEEHDPTYTKALETQHWLELVDPKHRYGSNLKFYHEKWVDADTVDNFFRWLDKGEGKDLSLPECSREQLESERIIFLSAEQRLNYLIKIDPDGKIRWDHNNEYVDTAPEKWKDAGDGKGIVSSDDDTKGKDDGKPKSGKLADVVNSVTKSESSSSVADQARHYEGIKQDQNMNTLQRIWKDRFTTKGLTQRVLRKTVQKNTWIYVSDKNYNVFVGIKETGYFQHSSPTAGGLVTSAGLIKVENGLVTSLSPLSGHYRTSVEHYRQFLDAMQKKGLDLSHVHVTKEEAILWGLERWTALAKSVKGSKKKVKGATWRLFHPKQANEADKEKEKKRIQEQDSSEQPKEAGTEIGGHEETDADKAKHKALTERMQQIKEKSRKEDEHWQTGSQWRWEIITGRAQQARKQGERKWKDAMNTISPGESGNASHSKPDGELSSPAEPERPSVLQNPPSQTNAESSERPQSSTIPRSRTEDGSGTPEERPPAYEHSERTDAPPEKINA